MSDLLGTSPKKDRKAEKALKEQQQRERAKRAEEEAALAARKSRARNPLGGLIATSERGLVKTDNRGKEQLSGVK